MNGVPYSSTPWSRLTDLLYMGGHTYLDSDGTPQKAVVDDEFDMVLSLHQEWGCGPARGVARLYATIPDGILTVDQVEEVREFADLGAAVIQDGERVLARCAAGYNRSGLLAAFILLRLGHGTADEVIDLIRARRSPHALCNGHFVRLIHAEARLYPVVAGR